MEDCMRKFISIILLATPLFVALADIDVTVKNIFSKPIKVTRLGTRTSLPKETKTIKPSESAKFKIPNKTACCLQADIPEFKDFEKINLQEHIIGSKTSNLIFPQDFELFTFTNNSDKDIFVSSKYDYDKTSGIETTIPAKKTAIFKSLYFNVTREKSRRFAGKCTPGFGGCDITGRWIVSYEELPNSVRVCEFPNCSNPVEFKPSFQMEYPNSSSTPLLGKYTEALKEQLDAKSKSKKLIKFI
ncbi:MAG: hypothetical protein US03_C0007G0037 [candidate division TM6 bacterium GW2011_GWF2_36_131]|nr:MAG: hypothetical protein US03_C0007G0037 [candidate division TM6 bacterium GW2011_GWF2_36_131]KKQ19579.1 MAG: hypothetical protein US32_C0007G0032 [candidate division TM6 bacterium GW2011_GWA2_36_9]